MDDLIRGMLGQSAGLGGLDIVRLLNVLLNVALCEAAGLGELVGDFIATLGQAASLHMLGA